MLTTLLIHHSNHAAKQAASRLFTEAYFFTRSYEMICRHSATELTRSSLKPVVHALAYHFL